MIEKQFAEALEPLVDEVVSLGKRLDAFAPPKDADPVQVAQVLKADVAFCDQLRGEKGSPGDHGADGKRGADGADGAPGAAADPVQVAKALKADAAFCDQIRGLDGVGIKSVSIAPGDAHMTLTLDDGSEIDVELPRGEKGYQGDKGVDGLGIETKHWAPGVYREGVYVTTDLGRIFKAVRDTASAPGSEDWERVGSFGMAWKGLKNPDAAYQDGDLYIDGGSLFIWYAGKGCMAVQRGGRGEKGDAGLNGKDGADAASIVHIKWDAVGTHVVLSNGDVLSAEMEGFNEHLQTLVHAKALDFMVQQTQEVLDEGNTPVRAFCGPHRVDVDYSIGDVVSWNKSLWVSAKKNRGTLNDEDWRKMIGGGGGSVGGSGGTPSDYTLPPATSTSLGGVKVGAGLTITVDGKLSTTSASYTLPVATTNTLGGIKVGSGLVADTDGTLSILSISNVLPIATPSILGAIKVGSGLAATNDGTLSVTVPGYVLPIATTNTLGGIKVGSGLAATADGTLSVAAAYLPLAGGTMVGEITLKSGLSALNWGSGAAIGYNGSELLVRGGTSFLSLSSFGLSSNVEISLPHDPTFDLSAATKGYVDSKFSGGGYTLPIASSTVLGGIKVGTGLVVAGDGKLAVSYSYTLPAATASALGGVKVGTGLAVTADGVLSATAQSFTLPVATASVLGGVKVGTGLAVNADGVLSMPGSYLPTAGGAMTGPMTVMSPTASTNPATKGYVDAMVNNANSYFLSILTGGTMEGDIILAHDPVQPLEACTKQYADKHLPLVGGTMTGSVTFNGEYGTGVKWGDGSKITSDFGQLEIRGAGGRGAAWFTLGNDAIVAGSTINLPLQNGIFWNATTKITAPISGKIAFTFGTSIVEFNDALGAAVFSCSVIVPTPVNGFDAATKDYVDAKTAAMQATIDAQAKVIDEMTTRLAAIAQKVGL